MPPTPCPNHQAIQGAVERDHAAILDIYTRLGAAETNIVELRGEIGKVSALQISAKTHLEEKIDDLKGIMEDVGKRIDAAMKAPMEAVKKLSEEVAIIKSAPGAQALEDRRKMVFEAVKWLMIIGLGAIVALKP